MMNALLVEGVLFFNREVEQNLSEWGGTSYEISAFRFVVQCWTLEHAVFEEWLVRP